MSDTNLNGRLCKLVDELVRQGLPLQQATRQFERHYLLAALRVNDGSVTRSAAALGVHRNTLRNKMEALGIAAQENALRPKRRAAVR